MPKPTVKLDTNGLPVPSYKVLELEWDEGKERGPGCPFCETPFTKAPFECCVGQSYHMLRSQIVKIAEIEDETTAMQAFFALVEECL